MRDALGERLLAGRSVTERRVLGQTYTPGPVVDAMVAWARRLAVAPARVVDPGCGSGRFLSAAAAAWPRTELVGVEIDPAAAAIARRNVPRAQIIEGDYRTVALRDSKGPTLFIGNPPYVRHHAIEPRWKAWLQERAAAMSLRASGLCGLHIHFLLATAALARAGDAGCFVMSSEWLDVNYGSLARTLLAGPLGMTHLEVADPEVRVFPDAMTTAAIVCFEVGAARAVRVRRARSVADLALAGGRAVPRRALAAAPRWTPLLTRPSPRPSGLIELGEICRVHRGQVTGANRIFIAGDDSPPLPRRFLVPTVTRARELIAAGDTLTQDHTRALRRVVALPGDLDALPDDERAAALRFVAWARANGADRGYVARHRTPWWSVVLAPPAPILATYMARRPPVFVRNIAAARHINIAHGLYPRIPLSDAAMDALAAHLSRAATPGAGRTYAGGLTKFEPREMERLLVPPPARA
ncbi:MAG TPA: methyltransferase domain-containing protein [Kofleriaceae bacterium]|nr:methyltransferase domain-containing protein [Kofleriaceae bacterium]